LILQIQRSWFCLIWSPKTEFIVKTVNSFQLNSKKKKNKKKVRPPDRTGPKSAQPAEASISPLRAAGIRRRPARAAAQQRTLSFLF
jgi:hypothetical protein